MRDNNPAALEQRIPQSMRFIIRVDDDAIVQALIVFCSFFWVRKQLVRRLDRIESDLRVRMRASVRVMAHRERPIRLLDFIGRRVRRNTENVV